jgi:hypothetical protein
MDQGEVANKDEYEKRAKAKSAAKKYKESK